MKVFTKFASIAIFLCVTLLLSSCGGSGTTNSGSPGGSQSNPAPTVTSLSPNSATAGAAAQTLTITGTGFVSSSTVTYNGASHPATFVSSTELTIQLSASDQATAGTYPVVVTNPPPGGGTSSPLSFTVANPPNPVPVITNLSPAAVAAGSAAQTLTIGGTGFMSTSTVTYNGAAHVVTFVSSTQLTIQLTASDQITGGNFPVVVTNPSPGGGTSNSENFLVYTGITAPTWQVLGPTAVPNAHSCDNANETNLFAAGKVQAFAVDLADPSTMYAAGGMGQGNSGPYSSAGIYMSTDGGKTWVQRDSGLGDSFVDALWLDQSNPQILLASTWLDGVYRSQDGGATWSNVLPTQSTVILQSGSSLYVATASGVSVSTDLGVTWQSVLTTSHPVRALAGEGGVLYAGLDDGTIMVEQTTGGAWTTVLTGGANPYGPSPSNVWQLAVNPSNAQEAIAVVTESGTFENLITGNGGGSWSAWTTPPGGGLCGSGGTAAYVAYDTVNPQIMYAGAGGALYVSQDGGKSWTAEHLLEDIRLIYPFPGQSGELVVGGDQGIYMSSDTGGSWTSLNGNLTTSLLNSIAVNGSEIISTVQDFSPITTFDAGSTWLQLSGSSPAIGENGVAVINPGNTNYQYIYNGFAFQYSTDGGQTFTSDASVPPGEWDFGAPIDALAVDPQNPSTLYLAGKDGIFQSTDWGVTWTLTTWGFQNPSLVDVGPGGTIFVGTPAGASTPGELHVSHDAGATWSTFQCPISWPQSLTVDPNDTSTVLMVTGAPPNVTGGGVLISTDGGSTFSSDNSGLSTRANIPSPFSNYTIRFAPPAYPGLVVVTTDDGAYASQAGGAWTNISGSAVLQFFYGLAWDSGYLYVSTFGEGALRIPITQMLTP